MSLRTRSNFNTGSLSLLLVGLLGSTALAAAAPKDTAAPAKASKAPAAAPAKAKAPRNVDYPYLGGDPGASRYSTLTQITAKNVSKLTQIWSYDLGGPTAIENQPIVVKGVIYGVGKDKTYALDAATGAVKWEYTMRPIAGRNPRGETFWTDGKERRLLVARGPVVMELDADTGQLVQDFGVKGEVDLNDQLRGKPEENRVGMTGSPVVYKNVFVTGGGVAERTPASPGDIRGWDVRTGKLLWTFHTIPHPGEEGYETWPKDAYLKSGGANAWPGMTLDPKTGVVFAGTGSPADDFYGGERLGDNLYGDSLIAIDVLTGKKLWHYQMVHHDLWDDDFAAAPSLATVIRNGNPVDVVVATNKTSYIWILDRKTGKPIFPVDEVPVPKSNVPGDVSSPTQPVPRLPPPLSRVAYTEADLSDRTPEVHDYVVKKYREMVSGPQYTPPAYMKETFVAPGFTGGLEWGGMEIDPKAHVAFFNTANVPSATAVTDNPPAPAGKPPNPLWSHYNFSGYHRFTDQEGYPGVKPPWGNLTAVDLNTGKFLWRIPFGSYPELEAKGMKDEGGQSVGGGVVTASGLLMIGATEADSKFHVYNSKTGKLIWETVLPHPGVASPATYMVEGRQFVAIATSGGGGRGGGAAVKPGVAGSTLVAFALPK